MFVDASAIVAILTREPEAEALTDVLEKGRSPITSPIAIFEAALGICRKRHASVKEAGEDVREFLAVAGVRAVPITEKEAETRSPRSPGMARGGGIRRNSTWATASLMRSQRAIGRRCYSRARISIRPTSRPPPRRRGGKSPANRSRAAGSDAGRRGVHAAARPGTPGGWM